MTTIEMRKKLEEMGYICSSRKDGYTRVFDPIEDTTDPDMGFCVSGIGARNILIEALRLNGVSI